VPTVGRYDVDRSRNLVYKMAPQWSVPKGKQIPFYDREMQMRMTLPEIGKYEVQKNFMSISRPYAKCAYKLEPKIGDRYAHTFYY
jgi:hypothetical protein